LIEKGLEQNFQLRMVRNEQKITDNNATPGNAGYLPTVDLNTTLGGTEGNTGQFPQDENSTVIRQSGVSNQNFSAGVNLNWTIFDGFNIQAKYSGLKELQQIGELKTRMNIEAFVSNLTAEYYNFIQQCIRLENLQSAVKLSKERLRIVEARYTIGNLSRLDLQQARVDFNTDSSKLIRQHEVLFASKVRINQLVGEESVDQEIKIPDQEIKFNSLLSKETLWSNVLEKNIYLLTAAREKNLKVLDLQAARSTNYPYLRLNAGYGYDSNIYEYGAYKKQNNLGFNYGVTLGFNLFDGFNRSRKQRNAQIEINNQELVIAELKLSLKSDFSNFWMAYLNNMELTNLEQENVSHARENYEIAIERYKLGDLSGIELREAQNSLLEAEERLVQAQYLTKLCEISLLEISGGIMEYVL
ncbi:MAG: TolC family protein, partial [Paludibacter sp.]|nr:TolC family protein [Paludibacter sp.]